MERNELIIKIMEMTRAAELKDRQHESNIAKLNHRIRELEHDNSILLDLLAQVMKDNAPAVVLREENFGKRHQFRIDENVGGEPLLIIIH